MLAAVDVGVKVLVEAGGLEGAAGAGLLLLLQPTGTNPTTVTNRTKAKPPTVNVFILRSP